jgi:hypothetical protein
MGTRLLFFVLWIVVHVPGTLQNKKYQKTKYIPKVPIISGYYQIPKSFLVPHLGIWFSLLFLVFSLAFSCLLWFFLGIWFCNRGNAGKAQAMPK